MPPVGSDDGKSGENAIHFAINGTVHKVSGQQGLGTSLNDYIRNVAGLKGTKVMCNEGGCGCCTVTVTVPDPGTDKTKTFSINSCLCPLLSVDGWQITTVEGIGSQKDGFHPIQDRVAKFNGTQCGYCTPGFVMSMYGFLHENTKPNQSEVESKFDGHICRCTGYRPILEGMKSFAGDSKLPNSKSIDIEDLNKNLCSKTGLPCTSTTGQPACKSGLHLTANGRQWYRPKSLEEVGKIIQTAGSAKTRFIYGNTASGIYKDEGPFDIYIDLHGINELYEVKVTGDIIHVGSNLTLSALTNKLITLGPTTPGFDYFSALASHIQKIGNHLVRNAGTWAGNLMIKYAHKDFPSDLFIMMEGAGAKVEVLDLKKNSKSLHTPAELITKVDMAEKILTSLLLHKQTAKHKFRSFKIMPRSQNTHAYVNAGFLMSVDKEGGKLHVLEKPTIVFGGINDTFVHAEKTETFLSGKLLDQKVVKDALTTLKSELKPNIDPLLAKPEYRRQLAINLLYKYLLGLQGEPSSSKLKSGGDDLDRPVSSSVQSFPEHKAEWPLKQPMPKLTAPLQASGEAQFVNDMPSFSRELYGALVLTTVGPAKLDSVDPSPALAIPGVVDYISAKDIPPGGMNTYLPPGGFFNADKLEFFCTKDVEYAGQSIGMILAETQALADKAAKLVKVTYKDQQTPILTIDQALAAGSIFPLDKAYSEMVVGTPEETLKSCAKTVTGEVRLGTQYHFYMENNVALCVPSEDGMDVYTAHQMPASCQASLSLALNKPMNYINLTVPRIGGGFGGKSFTLVHSSAAAVAAYKLKRPVRITINLESNMELYGKRFPMLARYQAGVDADGKLQVLILDVIGENGFSQTALFFIVEVKSCLDGAYFVPHFKVKMTAAKTHKPLNMPTRSPPQAPAVLIVETVLEHIAHSLGKSPILVKEMNLYEDGQKNLKGEVLKNITLRKMWKQLKELAEVDKRNKEVEAFNKSHQWKKRGLAMTPVKYAIGMIPPGMTVNVSIFADDGSVAVSQGGVEMGQGLFTKVAQAVAHSLGIPVDTVKVRPNQGIISPNNSTTGGSVGSEMAVQAALECSEILRKRIEPIKAKFPDDTWKELVGKCIYMGVDLSAKYTYMPVGAHHATLYYSCAVGAAEVELDVLTGEYLIRRVDILNDTGESLNPTIDIGQIEGAFVMGLGCYLMEDTIYDTRTGLVLNSGTWEYKPPTTKDIPIDWRVHLLSDGNNPVGVRGSKAVGEPPLMLAAGPLFALRQAMADASRDLTGSSQFFPVDAPMTVEKIQTGCGTDLDNLVL